ncbi:hypothetical protein D3C81_1396790 [compost metagenome]
MSFDTFHRADDDDRVIEHLQRSFHLCGEIDVTGRVQQKIRRFAVFHFGLISENGDPTRFLNFVTVEKSVAVVDPASIADRLRMEQQSLGKGRFAGVDMRQQSYRFIHGCVPRRLVLKAMNRRRNPSAPLDERRAVKGVDRHNRRVA